MLPLFLSIIIFAQGSYVLEGYQVIMPVKKTAISSYFGRRKDPLIAKEKFHSGVDFPARIGTSVRSVEKGQVIYSGVYSGFGNLVAIRHTNNLTTHYAHLWATRVQVGQFVKQGETIGFVGETGRTIGAHLHFETRWNGTPFNPLWILEARNANR